jgi:drug/metabolite transporter (DMT)-like permease
MRKQIIRLRISYWTAAIADFVIAVIVLFPKEMGLNKIEYPMGLMSAVAFSWGIMLLIADRKPLERRWVLIPTIIVVTLLTFVRILFEMNEKIETNFAVSLFGIVLIIFISYSYYSATNFANRK